MGNQEQVQARLFTAMTDEELVSLVHEGNTEALDFLINKFRHFVRMKARSYFLIGADERRHYPGRHDRLV